VPIVSYLISPQLIDRIFLPVPVLTAFKDIVIELEESAVIVAPVAVPVPVNKSPTAIPAVDPDVTVTMLLPKVVEPVTNCLPYRSAPIAETT
jgi:hypothetical protein